MCILGGGFYSAIASYFNSDCNPNTVRINMGREMFLVATTNIRKGEKRHQENLEKQKEIKLTKQSTLLIPTTMVDP